MLLGPRRLFGADVHLLRGAGRQTRRKKGAELSSRVRLLQAQQGMGREKVGQSILRLAWKQFRQGEENRQAGRESACLCQAIRISFAGEKQEGLALFSSNREATLMLLEAHLLSHLTAKTPRGRGCIRQPLPPFQAHQAAPDAQP